MLHFPRGVPKVLTMSRRLSTLLAVLAVAGGAAGYAAGGAERSSATPPPSKNLIMGGSKYTGAPTEKGAIKMAVLADVAGKIGGFGPAQIKAAQLMAKLANQDGGIMGHKVELIVRDDQADPAITAREMQSVIRTEKVNFVYGDVLSSALLAQAPLADQFQTPVIAGAGADVQYVQQQASIYHGMVSASSQVDACGFAKFMGARHKEWKRVALLVSKFAYGEDHAKDFVTCLKRFAPGAKVVVRKDFELGTQNFVPFITAIQGAKPDFIMTSSFGTDLVRFYQQYKGAGVKAPFAAFMDLDAAKAIGNSVPAHFVYGYARALYTELPAAAKPWIDAFVREYKGPPPDYAVTGMGAFLAYKAAVEKAGSLDPEKIMEAYRCLTYYEPRGWINVRTLNGQGDVPDYYGSLIADPKLGHPRFNPADRTAVFASAIWPSDTQVKALMPKSAVRSAADCK